MHWHTVSLLGIDVGFSKAAKSTGLAIYDCGQLAALTCIGSSAQDRADVLPDHMTFDAIAIDGPIMMERDGPPIARECEKILSRGAFSRRCKPGLSHFGFGMLLRHAATTIAYETQARITPAGKIVEAFPNSFLGVLLDDDDYRAMGKIVRGHKSDVFYRRVAENKTFEALLDHLGWHDDALLTTLHENATATTRAAHDKRAALVCLLTAACALSSRATYIGDDAGGHICLPPKALWAAWAHDALPPGTNL